tara:strand:- start:182 stop:472 length:291 start_codon:yes stop_codon:yes gene_type:complete
MKYIIIILLTFFLSFTSVSKSIHVDVEGLVCDFCAQSIQKVFLKQPGVEKVDVNLNNGRVIIKMADVFQDDEDGISNDRIVKLFLNAGYDVIAIMR